MQDSANAEDETGPGGDTAFENGEARDPGQRARLLRDAAGRAIAYLDGLPERNVLPTEAALLRLAEFDSPLPAGPTDPAEVLGLLDEAGAPATVATAGPRFFGLVIGGAYPVSVAAQWLAATWDQQAGMAALSPIGCTLERIAGRWMLELLGLPAGSHTSLTTGTTAAHVTALSAARQGVLARVGWDAARQGLHGAPEVRVLVGEEVHPSFLRAVAITGLGRDRVHRIPVDAQGRMRADALPEIDGPTILCMQAGNVNTGACDPFATIIPRAHAAGAWVHIDGAFGLWGAASPKHRHICEGVELADSWATDGHKWLNVPYDSGVAILRDSEHLYGALRMRAPYLAQGEGDPMDGTLEMSRRCRGIEIWAVLAALGKSGVAELIERCCSHAQRFAEGLRAAGHEVLADVVLNQVLVAFGDEERTVAVVRKLQLDGTAWFGTTRWQGRTAMRISVSSWVTSAEDVERCLALILRCADGSMGC